MNLVRVRRNLLQNLQREKNERVTTPYHAKSTYHELVLESMRLILAIISLHFSYSRPQICCCNLSVSTGDCLQDSIMDERELILHVDEMASIRELKVVNSHEFGPFSFFFVWPW